jgi:hypothetical protein
MCWMTWRAFHWAALVVDGAGNPGRAVRIDPMKPKLKAPGTERLKLKCDILLSTSAFKFLLRRYTLRRSACCRRRSKCTATTW